MNAALRRKSIADLPASVTVVRVAASAAKTLNTMRPIAAQIAFSINKVFALVQNAAEQTCKVPELPILWLCEWRRRPDHCIGVFLSGHSGLQNSALLGAACPRQQQATLQHQSRPGRDGLVCSHITWWQCRACSPAVGLVDDPLTLGVTCSANL